MSASRHEIHVRHVHNLHCLTCQKKTLQRRNGTQCCHVAATKDTDWIKYMYMRRLICVVLTDFVTSGLSYLRFHF